MESERQKRIDVPCARRLSDSLMSLNCWIAVIVWNERANSEFDRATCAGSAEEPRGLQPACALRSSRVHVLPQEILLWRSVNIHLWSIVNFISIVHFEQLSSHWTSPFHQSNIFYDWHYLLAALLSYSPNDALTYSAVVAIILVHVVVVLWVFTATGGEEDKKGDKKD